MRYVEKETGTITGGGIVSYQGSPLGGANDWLQGIALCALALHLYDSHFADFRWFPMHWRQRLVHEIAHSRIHLFRITIVDPAVELLQQIVILTIETLIL